MRARTGPWQVVWLTLVSGCGLGASVVGGPMDAATDVGVDVASDLGPMDVPPADVVTACRNSSECVGNAGGPVCDISSGRCVACSATDDRCAVGRRCDPTTFTCVSGCRNDDACSTATVDGGVGVAAPRCDPATHACVACVVDDHCTLGQRCMGNQCVAGCDATRGCVAGQTCCGGGCVDIRTNTGNCGGCGMACMVSNGSPVCNVGACGVASCADGFGNCDSAPANGCEVDTRVTLSHCGMCGHACPARAGATPTCAAGACGFVCDTGFADCDGTADNGCEADTRVSVAHCGACGTACPARENATTTCAAGACGYTCAAGFADCDGMADNGCEADTRTSLTHCGACGTACATPANGSAVCAAGACGVACATGFADCDMSVASGCEVDTRTSLAHCGMCGNACPARANAASTCASGACGFTCNEGFANCDGNAANGCEVDTRTSLAHCGMCGNACTFANAGATCTAGSCGLGVCTSGFGNCNATAGDGCEANLATNASNCGTCGHVCSLPHATASCESLLCAVAACEANFGNCDGSAATGCEAPLLTDANNCGACGNRCASGSCVAGLCNPFPSTGGEGAFSPATDIALSPGIHNFTTITIPVGVRITTTGTGVLDLRATGAVVINGIIDVSGSVGGEQAALGRGVSCVDNGNGSQGGFTGNVIFSATGGDGVAGSGQFGALGGGGTGSPGTDGTSRLGVVVAGRGSTGGGSGGGWSCTGGGGGGGGGFAGGGGGFGYQSTECGCLGTGGAGGTGGGAGSGAGGATVGQGGRGGTSGGDAAYNGAAGLTRAPVPSGCGYQTAIGGGGGGGSIGSEAVSDLAMATTFRPGSAGGGGGGDEGAGGGGGGGAVRVASPVSITVSGTGRIAAQGGRGGRQSCGGGPGGGGSGGAIYLASPALTVAAGAVVTATGGGGGGNVSVLTQTDGTGGLGRIRLSGGVGSTGCTLAGTFTPALVSGCTATATPTAARAYVARYPQ